MLYCVVASEELAADEGLPWVEMVVMIGSIQEVYDVKSDTPYDDGADEIGQ